MQKQRPPDEGSCPGLITHRPLERGLNPTAAASVSVLRWTCRWILWALVCVFACVCVCFYNICGLRL
ncbi:uncharacterized protein LOC117145598 isoform X2 [Drosophila mauritiana]|uniref:Uncharacterized protein LOC117145598 isoform X2 n=1 Tax=Drosophila mauritiana TaxID=7226 RepID=A0A6P8KEA4_DROMA|nr:uncharacterized protein LOC117145598 isoform X2 [Drosophila mauritiana]